MNFSFAISIGPSSDVTLASLLPAATASSVR